LRYREREREREREWRINTESDKIARPTKGKQGTSLMLGDHTAFIRYVD